jgi:Glycosyltransferase family 87
VFRADGRLAVGCLACGVVLLVCVGALGTSAAVPPLDAVVHDAVERRGWLPPYSLDLDPSPWVVVALQASGLVLGGAGVVLALGALRRGWEPGVRQLLTGSALAVAAFVLARPAGSADVLSYAAYGRIAVLGGDPYDVPPDAFAAQTGDPVVDAVEDPWRTTTSVYGPLATLMMRGASMIGGSSMRATVLVLSVLGALAYVATGLLLDRLAGRSVARRRRAAVLWAANPVLLYELVGGVHLDVEAAALGAGALLIAARVGLLAAVGAGTLVGAAIAVKATFGLYGIALLVPSLIARDVRRAAALIAGTLVVAVPTYVLAGPHVFDRSREAARLISRASPWNLIRAALDEPLGLGASRPLIGALAIAAAAALAALLLRAAPAGERLHPVRLAFVLSVSWLLTALYSLPWYDAMLFVPLAALAATVFDGALIARLTVLAVAYVPGRALVEAPLPPALADLTAGWRGWVTPVLLLGILGFVVVRAVRAGAEDNSVGTVAVELERSRRPAR